MCKCKKGNIIWQYETYDVVYAKPIIDDGLLYIGSYDNHLYCLDALTGKFMWRFLGGGYGHTPAISGNNLFCFGRGKLHCLDKKTSAYIWDIPFDSYYYGSIVHDNGRLFLGSYDGYLYCIDANNGKELWKVRVADNFSSFPVIWNGNVYLTCFKWIYCLNSKDGSEIWSKRYDDEIYSSPVISNGVVYYSTTEKFIAADAKNGSEFWMFDDLGYFFSSPVITKNRVIIYDNSELYCFGDKEK